METLARVRLNTLLSKALKRSIVLTVDMKPGSFYKLYVINQANAGSVIKLNKVPTPNVATASSVAIPADIHIAAPVTMGGIAASNIVTV